MNVKLFNPKEYSQPYPTQLTDKIDLNNRSSATALKFSRRGDYLAIGCYNGDIKILDFQTKTIIRNFSNGHKKYNWKGDLYDPCISSVAWFSNEKYLLSCGWDRRCIIWDIENSKLIEIFKFNSGVKFIDCHPKIGYFLACPWWDVPYLILDIKKKIMKKIPIKKKCLKTNSEHDYMVARFSRTGNEIFVGNSFGDIIIYNTNTLNVTSRFSLAKEYVNKRKFPIHDFIFSKKGHFILINTGEILHLYHTETHYLVGKFFDVVKSQNKVFQHNCIGFSGYCLKPRFDWDSQYIFASGTNSKQASIWDRNSHQLVHILQGSKDNILCMEWHPRSPVIITSSNHSKIYIWSKMLTEGWSSFAPQFQTLENNQMYIEREDEFDNVENVGNLRKNLNSYQSIEEGYDVEMFEQNEKSPYESDEDIEEFRFFSTKPSQLNGIYNKEMKKKKKKKKFFYGRELTIV